MFMSRLFYFNYIKGEGLYLKEKTYEFGVYRTQLKE